MSSRQQDLQRSVCVTTGQSVLLLEFESAVSGVSTRYRPILNRLEDNWRTSRLSPKVHGTSQALGAACRVSGMRFGLSTRAQGGWHRRRSLQAQRMAGQSTSAVVLHGVSSCAVAR